MQYLCDRQNSAKCHASAQLICSARTCLGFVFALFFTSVPVFAQQGDGQSFKVGESDLYPSVRIDMVQDDNAFLSSSDEESVSAIRIRPELNWIADRRLLKVEGSYVGIYQAASESILNYNDHQLKASVDAELTKRKRAGGSLSVSLGHQALGTNLTRGEDQTSSEQVLFTDTQANAFFEYGAQRARGNIVVGVNIGQFNYRNRSDVTSGRDFSSFQPYGRFSLRVSGDTRATFELRHRTFNSSAIPDRNDISILAGLQFAATGKSGGSIALGSTQSSYDAAGVDDRSNFIIEGRLFWEPRTFSRFSLNLNRNLDGVNGGLASTDSPSSIGSRARLRWDYRWSERIRHIATLGIATVETDCPSRNTQTNTVGLEVDVAVRRWLSVGVSGSSENRTLEDCSADPLVDPDLDYGRTIFGVYLQATL